MRTVSHSFAKSVVGVAAVVGMTWAGAALTDAVTTDQPITTVNNMMSQAQELRRGRALRIENLSGLTGCLQFTSNADRFDRIFEIVTETLNTWVTVRGDFLNGSQSDNFIEHSF
jgi:hypothetical protein